jgi:hypothetical protein
LGFILLVSLCFIGLNYALNDYGLWRDQKMPPRIYGDPLTAKYLMSLRAMPREYNSLLIGPSVSANIETADISSLRMYNLSVQGANIIRLRPAIEAFMTKNKNPGTLIFCLYPYITNNLELSPSKIYEEPDRSALFSTVPARALMTRVTDVFSTEEPYDHSAQGMIDISEIKKADRPPFSDYALKLDKKKDKLQKTRQLTPHERIVDPHAYEVLNEVLEEARAKGYKIIAYYYPLNYRDYQVRNLNGEWPYFEQMMGRLFKADEPVWNFNADSYNYIRRNDQAYMDNHFNRNGADLFARALDQKLATLPR